MTAASYSLISFHGCEVQVDIHAGETGHDIEGGVASLQLGRVRELEGPSKTQERAADKGCSTPELPVLLPIECEH